MHADETARAREALLREIAREVEETAAWTGRRRLSDQVIEALRKVPREAFVPPEARDMAYANAPLSIGHGQTISQPYIVAIMTELLDLTPESVVLEVGTGCGYQAAVLGEIAREVYSVEFVESLAAGATERLRELGYDNVHVRQGDGRQGWPEHAPYDAVMATAAGADAPPALIEQLAPGGRLVAPFGSSRWDQRLVRIVKDREGRVHRQDMLPVAFVPLVGTDA